MILEMRRLVIREMKTDDHNALYAILGDPDVMKYYPCTFDKERVRGWIERNRSRYREEGFGLWAVCLKETYGSIDRHAI